MTYTRFKIVIVSGVVAIAVGTTIILFKHYQNAPFAWTKELSRDDDAQYLNWTGMTPEQAAKTFFEACSREDWIEVAKFWEEPGTRSPIDDKFRSNFGGLQIVSLGKSFRGGPIMFGGKTYPGVFLSYAIRLKNGKVEKGHLAIRCDNPEKRWHIDGGM